MGAPLTSMQFSLRTLLVTAVSVGCWFGVLRIVPQVAVLLSGVFVAALSAFLMIRLRHGKVSRIAHVAVYVFAISAWLYFYVLSIGPFIAFDERVNLDNEVVRFVYAPVVWLHDTTPRKEPLEQYARLWGWQ